MSLPKIPTIGSVNSTKPLKGGTLESPVPYKYNFLFKDVSMLILFAVEQKKFPEEKRSSALRRLISRFVKLDIIEGNTSPRIVLPILGEFSILFALLVFRGFISGLWKRLEAREGIVAAFWRAGWLALREEIRGGSVGLSLMSAILIKVCI